MGEFSKVCLTEQLSIAIASFGQQTPQLGKIPEIQDRSIM